MYFEEWNEEKVKDLLDSLRDEVLEKEDQLRELRDKCSKSENEDIFNEIQENAVENTCNSIKGSIDEIFEGLDETKLGDKKIDFYNTLLEDIKSFLEYKDIDEAIDNLVSIQEIKYFKKK